jgi:hypothetical protein
LPIVAAVTDLLARAYRHRFAADEEDLLPRDLPVYLECSRRAKKLIPFIW